MIERVVAVAAGFMAVGADLRAATAAMEALDRVAHRAAAVAPQPVTPAHRAGSARPPSANPLWTVPLDALSVTRARPIFSASRRPPPPAVVAAPDVARVTAAKPAEPERPPLDLVGTIIGKRARIGVFLDQAAHNVVRLRLGQDHAGWSLRAVQGRAATLERNRRTVVLAMPAAGAAAPAPAAPQPAATPVVTPDLPPRRPHRRAQEL